MQFKKLSKGLKHISPKIHNEKIVSISLRDMQIKTTMRYLFTPIRMAITKYTNKQREVTTAKELERNWNPCALLNGNVKWCNSPGKRFRCSSKS